MCSSCSTSQGHWVQTLSYSQVPPLGSSLKQPSSSEREKDVKVGPQREVIVAAMMETLAADLSSFSGYIGKGITASRKKKKKPPMRIRF